MIPWLSTLALAAAPAEYPLSATVTMPEQGVVAVRVPPQLRSADDPEDGTDLLLLDATGAAVPFALVARAADAWTERVAVDVAATPDPDVWTLELGPIPLDGLVVDLPPSVRSAEVIVEDLGGKRLGDPTLVWRTPGSASDLVSFTPATGPIQVKVQVKAGADDGRGPGFVGLRRVKGGVPSDRITVPVGPPVIQENGYTRYIADLERAMPVDRVRVVTDAAVFERTASIEPWRWYDARPDALDLEPSPSTAQRIVRTGPDQEMTVLSGPTPPSDRLVLLLGTDGKAPLPVSALELEFDAVQLLVQDPGPGPHTLYAGARPGTSPHWDLEVAAPELARREPVVVEPSAVGPNPTWVPPEVRAELVGLGPEVPHTGWARWERPIEAEGAVRIPLPADVLALSRPDLGDLRIVSGSQQVPYVLRRRPIDQPLTIGEPERTEVGGRSRIRVPLPKDGPPIAAITLTTPATVFDRQVAVSRAAGANLETLRAVQWVGTERPGRLTVSIGRRVAGELLIEIDNGDDPPLPVDDIMVTVQGWELVAVVPAGSVLRYGDPSLWPPSYDLTLMEDELRRRPMPEASLGAAIAAGRTPLSMLDRFLMAIGVGVLGVGLALLAADLLRRTKPPAEPDEAGEPAFEGEKVTAEAEPEPAKEG